jgi:hypothetical protein
LDVIVVGVAIPSHDSGNGDEVSDPDDCNVAPKLRPAEHSLTSFGPGCDPDLADPGALQRIHQVNECLNWQFAIRSDNHGKIGIAFVQID